MRRLVPALVATVALGLAGESGASAEKLGPVFVHTSQPNISANVRVSFRPIGHLPRGGYYYSVVVLSYLRGTTSPKCAISSDMARTNYGFPRPGRFVELSLYPARAGTGHWCMGGVYAGAIYAVPHKPPCSSAYPCYGKRACGGGTVCGVVAIPYYSYPGGLPAAIDRHTRIVGRFRIVFPTAEGQPPG